MANFLYQDDLPADIEFDGDLAIDTETNGLNILHRDRLCLVQISDGKGDAHLVQTNPRQYDKAENLRKLIADENRVKIFHYGRFDLAVLKLYLGIDISNVYCTKIASKIGRTYTDKHGLKDLCRDLLRIDLSKQNQTSNWAAKELTEDQLEYAASDVLYLHQLRVKLEEILANEDRHKLAHKCMAFLPTRVELDIRGWYDLDIFAHHNG